MSGRRVRATLRFLQPAVRAMARVQLLTGMRPGEVCQLRPADLDTSGDVWLFRPRPHKTRHRNKLRVVAIGPKAQAVLSSFTPPSLPKKEHERLASRLLAGEDPKVVFADFFAPKSADRHVKPADAAYARSLERAQADLGDRLDDVRPCWVSRNEVALRAGKRLVRQLLAKLEPAGE